MKQWIRNNRGFLIFLLCFGVFRTAIADWNPIPSGSMRPTILEGDVVFINRLAFDLKLPLTNLSLAVLGEPRRGDIVTFSSPRNGTRLIKRIVALPGDTVEMRNETLVINGRVAEYSGITFARETVGTGINIQAARAVETVAGSSRTVQFLAATGGIHSFGPIVVPQANYFMLGDNRDNSEDSRFIGFVPRALLIGRATGIVVSADITDHWLPRFERFASTLH